MGEPLYQDVVAALAEALDRRARGQRHAAAASDWRTVRVGVEGIHAGDGRRRCSTNLRPSAPKRHFTVGIYDDVTHLSLPWDPELHDRSGRRDAGRVLRAGQRRHGRGEQELGEDHRREHAAVCPGIFCLRLEEGGRGHGVASAVQPAADPIDVSDRAGEFRRLPSVPLAGTDGRACRSRSRGRRFCSTVRIGPDEVWDQLPREVQQQIIDKRLRFFVVDGYDVAAASRAWAAGSTRRCRPASSRWPGMLPREEAIEHIKDSDPQDVRQAGRDDLSSRILPRSTGRWSALHEVEVPDGRRRAASAVGRRSCTDTTPILSSE